MKGYRSFSFQMRRTRSAHSVTMGELFKSAGYATAIFGKWHLGKDPKSLPTTHGFDEYCGSRGLYRVGDRSALGRTFGPNETDRHFGKPASYEQAKPDLKAALDWATAKHLPVVLWGSSYSASLVFEIAAKRPQEVSAVMTVDLAAYRS